MNTDWTDERIERVRRFNRQYTKAIGLINERVLGSALTLTQLRLLYEIATRESLSAAQLCQTLDMDAGQASRLLRGLLRDGLIQRQLSADDGRVWQLSATDLGRQTFDHLRQRARLKVAELLDRLSEQQQCDLLQALDVIEPLLAQSTRQAGLLPSPVKLRPHRIGDLGWVVHRQSILCAQVLGPQAGCEALLAAVGARFIERFRPSHEASWIAHRGEQILGSVFLMQQSARIGQLRLMYVEPAARGQGVGERLVQACIDRARSVGYRRLDLWTHEALAVGRRLYERKGFVPVSADHQRLGSEGLGAQRWALKLTG